MRSIGSQLRSLLTAKAPTMGQATALTKPAVAPPGKNTARMKSINKHPRTRQSVPISDECSFKVGRNGGDARTSLREGVDFAPRLRDGARSLVLECDLVLRISTQTVRFRVTRAINAFNACLPQDVPQPRLTGITVAGTEITACPIRSHILLISLSPVSRRMGNSAKVALWGPMPSNARAI